MPGTIIENPEPLFAASCKLAKIPTTVRQWRRWKRGAGIARYFQQAAEIRMGLDRPGMAQAGEEKAEGEAVFLASLPSIRFS